MLTLTDRSGFVTVAGLVHETTAGVGNTGCQLVAGPNVLQTADVLGGGGAGEKDDNDGVLPSDHVHGSMCFTRRWRCGDDAARPKQNMKKPYPDFRGTAKTVIIKP